MYNIAQSTETGGTRLLNQPTFNSIQERTRFELQTSIPGRIYYEVKQIGDAAYPLAKHKNAVIPRSQRLLFEQQVHVRPTARFKSRPRLSYCVNEPFTETPFDSVVVLEGLPPFTLDVAVKNLVNSHVDYLKVTIPNHEWRVDLPDYRFTNAGAHRVSITAVSDSSSCEQGILDPLETAISVDVAETAAIIPFDHREHYCVGEMAQFQLEGKPPWTIG
jgi:nucleoporin POM152